MASSHSSEYSFARGQENVQNSRKILKRQASTPVRSSLHRDLLGDQRVDSQLSPANRGSIQRGLDIRTRESSSEPNQSFQYQVHPASNSVQQKRPHYVIDLTKDDDEQPTPRKKSRSSSDSSEGSVKIISGPERPLIVKQEDRDPRPTTGHVKRKEESRPAYQFWSYQSSTHPSTEQPSLPSSSEELIEQSSGWGPSSESFNRLPSRQSSTQLSSTNQPPLKLFSRPPSTHSQQQQSRQYASAVIVRSTPQPADPTPEEIQQRQQFLQNLEIVPDVTLSNAIDNSSPPESFRFVTESILREGVCRAPQDVMVGCECRRKFASNECKYPNDCSCLKDSSGESLKKSSQYFATGKKTGCLFKQFLHNRWNIFECNPRCDCSVNCKNRVVQWGRKVGLEIFKTRDRGWGLRCHQDLLEGQFVDTYRGEIITTEQADQRKSGADEDNYLFDFDKFGDTKYVCDGRHMGGPTRFMNHSCQPNCALFTVSYNHYDPYIYELAFFAQEFIPAGTELTFDYQDQEELEDTRITEQMAAEMEKDKGYAPSKCRCGSEHCRGYFFFSK